MLVTAGSKEVQSQGWWFQLEQIDSGGERWKHSDGLFIDPISWGEGAGGHSHSNSRKEWEGYTQIHTYRFMHRDTPSKQILLQKICLRKLGNLRNEGFKLESPDLESCLIPEYM